MGLLGQKTGMENGDGRAGGLGQPALSQKGFRELIARSTVPGNCEPGEEPF